jgi:hypothetical protein
MSFLPRTIASLLMPRDFEHLYTVSNTSVRKHTARMLADANERMTVDVIQCIKPKNSHMRLDVINAVIRSRVTWHTDLILKATVLSKVGMHR